MAQSSSLEPLAAGVVQTNAALAKHPILQTPAPATDPSDAIFSLTNQQALASISALPLIDGATIPNGAAQLNPNRQLSVVSGGAVGEFGAHKAGFASNLHTPGAVDLVMAGGQRLQSQILGLAYYTADGQSILIAELKDSVGEIISPNQIIYRDAFDTAKADVLLTYTESSMEQDVIIRKQLPAPEKFGLNPAITRLTVLTEFLSPPIPRKLASTLDLSALNQAAGVQGEASLPDELIIFNSMRIGRGRAFTLGDSTVELPVGKSWRKLEGRDFLIESTPYPLLKPLLNNLPPDTAQFVPRKKQNFRTALLQIHTPTGRAMAPSAVRLASARPPEPGVVLDYLISSSPALNINFGSVATNKTGFAAVGQSANDYWNGYSYPYQTLVTVTNLLWSNTNTSGANLTVSNATGVWGNPVSDGMYASYINAPSSQNIGISLTNLASGTYDFYLYGHGAANNQSAVFTLASGTNSYGTQSTTTTGSNSWNSTVWQEGQQYIVFRSVSVVSHQLVSLLVTPSAAGWSVIGGMQVIPDNPQTNITSLVNINFGNYTSNKVGFAAVGLTTNDVWTGFHENNVTTPYGAGNLPWSDGFASPIGITVSNTPGQWFNPVSDGMFSTYVYPNNGGTIGIGITNLANGRYDFYLYGHGAADNQSALFQMSSGTNNYASKATASVGSNSWTSVNWQEGQQYVVFRDVWVTTNQPVLITSLVAPWGYAVINGMQIVLPMPSDDTDSNNDGIPDWWALQYGLSPHDPAMATEDLVGDGVSNYIKYLEGRNPLVPAHTDTNNIVGLNVFTPLK